MKKLYLYILSILILSCDIEETPYMLDNSQSIIDSNSYVQKILIEDFTGHTCQNCPAAAAELSALKDLYPEKIIGVALHVGNSFARPYPSSSNKYQYDFRTQWGEEIDQFFEVSPSGIPKGLVNRKDYPNNHRKNKDDWLSNVQDLLDSSPLFDISINNSILNEDYEVSISIKSLENISNLSLNLVVYLTEDSIINWQKNGSIDEEFYLHNHVLRSVLNTTWGEQINLSNSYNENDIIEKKLIFNLLNLQNQNIQYSNNNLFQGNGNAGNWNSLHLNIIAYIYNTETYEIVQVEKKHLNN